MIPAGLARIDWPTEAGALLALEAEPGDVASHADALAAAYNEPTNAALMSHDETISAREVIEHYAAMRATGARAFLLFRDGELAGDADLRGVRAGTAEFAFMIGAPDAQGKGLGTRFAIMVHGFGFVAVGLDRIYASIVPHNVASRRVFDKLGYEIDDRPAARAYADEPGDITLGLAREQFTPRYAAQLAELRFSLR